LIEVSIRRYSHVPTCDVVVIDHDRQAWIRCDNYDAAVRWAQVECKSYGVIAGVKVENDSGGASRLSDTDEHHLWAPEPSGSSD
jgi:hypothetical protein